jgi:hypothetical protein
MRLLQKSQFCHSRSDSERKSGSNCLKNHIRPRMLVSGIETFGDDKQFCKSLELLIINMGTDKADVTIAGFYSKTLPISY